jgi:hypothetical protein
VLQTLVDSGVDAYTALEVAQRIKFHDHQWQDIAHYKDEALELLIAADTFAFFTSVADDMYLREGEQAIREKMLFMIRKMPPQYQEPLAQTNFSERAKELKLDQNLADMLERLKTEILEELNYFVS